jgi:UPF0755 protein
MRLRDPLTIALLLTALYSAAVVVGLVWLLGQTSAVVAAELAPGARAPRPVASQTVEIAVEQGMSADEIAVALAQRGVIVDADRFATLLAFTGLGAQLQAGRYEIPANTPAAEVIRRMRLGLTAELLVAIPEGLRLEEVGEVLADLGLVTMEEWREALELPWPHAFLQERPEGASLLGYLMPASYPVTRRSSAEEVVEIMLDHFGEQVDASVIAEAETRGLTLHELLTLASIVEREAAVSEEQPLVASVFLNRIEDGIPLQADPTVQFAVATAESVERYGWWKHGLTVDDLALDSPYNTYVYAGLPPGPIANPGLNAILAVIRAPETDYVFFVAAPECDGSHRFAATLDEHSVNVEAFRRSPCGE